MMPKDACYLTGAKEAAKNTEAMLRRLHGKEFSRTLIPAGEIFLKRASELAPYDETRKKGKHLREALFLDAREHEAGQTDILVGVNHRKAPHAHLMEMGWEKKPEGVPFMRPAATQTRDKIGRAVKEALDTAIMGKYRSAMWE